MIRLSNGLTGPVADTIYLRLDTTNDPLTDGLTITPVNDSFALNAQKEIRLKTGVKLIFDGA